MQTKYSSEWLTIHPVDQKNGNVYIYIGSPDQPLKIEGWLTFPKGSKAAKISVCFDDENESPADV